MQLGRVSQRARMLLLSIRRQTVPVVADFLEVCYCTVRLWIQRCNAAGPYGPYDPVSRGRLPKPSGQVTDTLVQWSYSIRERMRKEDFIAALEYLLGVCAGGPGVLVMDNDSSHTAHVVEAWLKEHVRMQLLYLPRYGSHLNPTEPIWLRLKNAAAPNRLYDSMKTLLDSPTAFLDNTTPTQTLAWAAASRAETTLCYLLNEGAAR